MSFFGRFIHNTGVVFIILFCTANIIFSYLERQMQGNLKKYMSYASYFENNFYDFRMKRILNQEAMDDKTVLVAVDDETLQKIQAWPVPRTVWASFIDKMGAWGAKVVAFDVLFPEPVKACGAESPDDVFKTSIENFQTKGTGKIILAYTTEGSKDFEVFEETPEELFNYMIDSEQSGQIGLEQKWILKHNWPIKKLLDAGPELGYISMEEDVDGVFRHYQLVNNVDSLYFPSIGLKAYETFLGKGHKLEITEHGMATMKVGDKTLMINNRGETKIRWFGREHNFGFVPMHEILVASDNDEKMIKAFKDKIVFVGSTATGAHDLRNTPLDPKTPGVYAHMNIVHMLMHGYNYVSPDESLKYSFIFLIVGMILLLIAMHFGNAFIDLFSVIVICAITYFVDVKFFLPHGYEIKLFFTLFAFTSSYSWITFLNFNQASNEKKQIKGAFSRYVAVAVVDDMLKNPDKLKVGGEKRDITCLFSDVRDFTSISEKLTATELAWALNRYMGKMTDIVFETKGTLDKYIGDAIVAFWGAPLDIGDHVNLSVEAAVKMLEALPAINQEFKEKGLPEFKIGLGLNSGECSVGNMGSDQIFAYTALGDNMNLGARLESLCKHYGAQILISHFTHKRLDHARFKTRLIDLVKVKGKSEPVGVYEVLYSYHPFMKNPQAYDAFQKAYQLFIEKKFEMSIQLFDEILGIVPEDKASKRLKASCEKWIENPPKEGEDHTITTMTEK